MRHKNELVSRQYTFCKPKKIHVQQFSKDQKQTKKRSNIIKRFKLFKNDQKLLCCVDLLVCGCSYRACRLVKYVFWYSYSASFEQIEILE